MSIFRIFVTSELYMFTENNRPAQLHPLLAYTLLFLVYTSTFRIFATLPLETLHQTLSTLAIILLTTYYLFSLFLNFKNSRISKLDVLMWMFILVNFLAAFKGHEVFGQPYYYGIMAQRSVLLSISGILIVSLLNKGMITIRQVERSFLFISLALLFVFYFFFLFVNPVKFNDAEFVAYSPIRGYRYRFQFALVIMLLFYSLFKVSHEQKNRFIIIALLILFYLIYFLQSRTTLVVLAITILIYFIRNFSLKEKLKNTLLYGGIGLIFITILFTLGYTSLFDKYQVLYQNVFNVFQGESPDEASSAVRFMELLGNVFVFGILGTILIYLPYYFSLTMSREVKSNHVFYKTCEYMLLFFFLCMFFSAVNIRDSSSIMFLVCLLYYFRYFYDENRMESETIKPINA